MTKPYGWPGDCRQVTCWEVWKQGLEPQTTMSILTTAVTASFNDVTAAAMGQQCLFDRAAQLRALIAASTRLLSHFLSGFWIIAFHQPGNNTFSDLFSNYYYSSRVINCKAAGYCFATITALIFCGFIFHIGERLFFAASIEWRRKKTCKKFSDKSNVCSRPGLAVFKMFWKWCYTRQTYHFSSSEYFPFLMLYTSTKQRFEEMLLERGTDFICVIRCLSKLRKLTSRRCLRYGCG